MSIRQPASFIFFVKFQNKQVFTSENLLKKKKLFNNRFTRKISFALGSFRYEFVNRKSPSEKESPLNCLDDSVFFCQQKPEQGDLVISKLPCKKAH